MACLSGNRVPSPVSSFGIDRCRRGRPVRAHGFGRLVVRIKAALHTRRTLLSRRVLVERLKLDIVLAEQVLVLAETFQELSLGKSTFAPARRLRRWYTLRPRLDAIAARELAVTLHLALLAKNTRKYPPSFGAWQHGRHDGSTGGVPCITTLQWPDGHSINDGTQSGLRWPAISLFPVYESCDVFLNLARCTPKLHAGALAEGSVCVLT